MENDALYISRPKLLCLKLDGVRLHGDCLRFVFVDKWNNKYIHDQVSPNVAASASKATRWLMKVTRCNYEPSQVVSDFTKIDTILDKYKPFVGTCYQVYVVMRKMNNGKTYFNVDDIFDFSDENWCREHFENALKCLYEQNWEEDYIAENRIREKYRNSRKEGELL